MKLVFNPEGHAYESIGGDFIDWVSVTGVISVLKNPFDTKAQSVKSSKNPRSIWFGLTPEEIKGHWRYETDQSNHLGDWYHDQREQDITSFSTIVRKGKEVPIFKPLEENGKRIAPSQRLVEGVYPEHFVFLKSAGITGQSDRVEVINNIVDVSDYKTSKEINFQSYRNWEGIPKMMLHPVSHLEDCEIVHYGLQLSTYMYMVLKHNPQFKPGIITIDHIIFEEGERNKFNQRNLILDNDKKPILKRIERHTVPYYKEEVQMIINEVIKDRNRFRKK